MSPVFSDEVLEAKICSIEGRKSDATLKTVELVPERRVARATPAVPIVLSDLKENVIGDRER